MRVLTVGVCVAGGCGRPRGLVESPRGLSVVEKSGTVEADKVLPDVEVGAEDWPWWRGPTRDGLKHRRDTATTWSRQRTSCGRRPCPVGVTPRRSSGRNRVFVATAVEEPAALQLLGLDRASGKVVWTTDAHQGTFETTPHEKNSQASATPACDGDGGLHHVPAFRAGLADGDRSRWKKGLPKGSGPFASQHGYAASPLIWKSLVIVSGESDAGSFLCAYQRKTATLFWSVKRGDSASYSSPPIFEVAGKPQLLISGGNKVQAYSPDDGFRAVDLRRWSVGGHIRTMVAAGDNVFASGGFPEQQTLCLKGSGTGKLGGADIVWQNREKFYVPSMLCRDGSLYGVNDSGNRVPLRRGDGKEVWKKRLGGGSAVRRCGRRVGCTFRTRRGKRSSSKRTRHPTRKWR